MTEQKYKIGDKVLVEMIVNGANNNDNFIGCKYENGFSTDYCYVKKDFIRPYTPRQEFEYGEEVEVRKEYDKDEWVKAIYIGKSFSEKKWCPYVVNLKFPDGTLDGGRFFEEIRKLKTQPRETITIGNTIYDKEEFENAIKNLKPVEDL